MNESELEWILTHTFKKNMIEYIEANPAVFEELIQLIFATRKPYSWRAAWLLWSCMDENDPRVKKYISRMITSLPLLPDNMKKDICLVLLKMEIDEDNEGILFDQCVSIWEDQSKKPAVRHNSLKIMLKIAGKYPELLSEITSLTKDIYLQNASPGLKRSVLKQISKLKNKKNEVD